jgi:hypothetical protein
LQRLGISVEQVNVDLYECVVDVERISVTHLNRYSMKLEVCRLLCTELVAGNIGKVFDGTIHKVAIGIVWVSNDSTISGSPVAAIVHLQVPSL